MNSLHDSWVTLNKMVERHNENGKLKSKKNNTLENTGNQKTPETLIKYLCAKL